MKFKSLIILLSMLLLVSCSNADESMTEFDTNELQIESYTYSEEFTLEENLNKAITELALMYDNFDWSKTKEDTYGTSFISHYCQNSRLSYDYLEKMRRENNGILSEEHVRYIQYSLTKENVDFQDNIPLGGIDINQSTSSLGFGKILSYEAEEDGEEVHLVAQFERGTDGSENTNLYELSIVLIKNPQSCFDGYSIKTLSSQNITPIITGDNREHTFYAYDLEIEENGIFTFENYGGEDDVQYGTHIEIDLSENQILADFVRENAGKEFDVTYIFDDSMTQPVYRVVPVSIALHDEGAEPTDENETALYETIQSMIDEADKEFFERPDYFGTTLYTEDKFEEIKQYEMNIVLHYLGIKHWNRPTSSEDEIGLPVDAPLGEYTVEKLKEYTDEEHDLTVEYFCGGSILDNLNNRYIALIIKEYKNGNIENL